MHVMLLPPHLGKHQRMSHDNRTAQFSPFAALTGCEAEVAEAGQMTNCRIELSECEIAKLNERNTFIQRRIDYQLRKLTSSDASLGRLLFFE